MAVVFKDVNFTYLKNTPFKKEVLKDINLELPTGKITSIIGPNGSGKTTLVELICGLLSPDSGEVLVDDFKITAGKKIKRVNQLRYNIGLSFQFPEEQFFESTVYKEIAFGMKHFKYKTNNKEKRIIDSLLLVGLNASYLYKNPYELSGGEKRKVAIASILAFNPKIIILDEPTVGLDDRGKEMLMRLLIKLKENYGKTIIIISHDVDLMYKFVDKVIILKDGRIVKEGNKYQVFNNVEYLKSLGIEVPKLVLFNELVYKEKEIKLGDYDDVKDLMKAVYRNVK